MKKYIITGIGIVALGGVGTSVYLGEDKRERFTFDPATAQVIVWEKPTTNAGWAKDVEVESFHIKSTGKLTEMRTVHAEKLKRVQDGKAEVFECPECIKFQARKGNPEWTQKEIDAYYLEQLAQANWEVEKLKQSVERMDNELRLRDKGFVVVEGETLQLGGTSNKIIRYIND
jgi:hypothetical protein